MRTGPEESVRTDVARETRKKTREKGRVVEVRRPEQAPDGDGGGRELRHGRDEAPAERGRRDARVVGAVEAQVDLDRRRAGDDARADDRHACVPGGGGPLEGARRTRADARPRSRTRSTATPGAVRRTWARRWST